MPDRLKILQFVRGSERYGASVSIRNLCHELKTRGHEVVPVLYKNRGLGSDILEDFRVMELAPSSKFSLRGLMQVRELFKREKPDIVHTHLSNATLLGSFAGRMAEIPVISTVHGMNSRWTYSFANRLITVSEAAKQHLVRQGIPASKISVAYNGIAIPACETLKDGSELRKELGLLPEHIVLATISRADYGKGIQDAVAAVAMLARRHPQIQYLFAGEGECVEALQAQATKLQIQDRVHFLGYRTDVFDILSAVDVFLFPSLKEAMGISMIEAMAMGVPVIASRTGGIPEVVDSETGILTPPGNAAALAEAVDCLLEDPTNMRAMGERARQRALERFSLAASADQVEQAYAVLLNAKR